MSADKIEEIREDIQDVLSSHGVRSENPDGLRMSLEGVILKWMLKAQLDALTLLIKLKEDESNQKEN
jgi:hypothetical protein